MEVSLDDLDAIASAENPTALDAPSLSTTEGKTDQLAQSVFSDPNRPDPHRPINLAYEVIKVIGSYEKDKAEKDLKNLQEKADEFTRSIDLLLDLSRETGKLNSEKPKITDEIRSLLEQLKSRGINLDLTNGKEIDKEQLMTLKSAIGSHTDKLRMEVQQIFTKMQTVLSSLSSVLDSGKKIIEKQDELLRRISERSIKR